MMRIPSGPSSLAPSSSKQSLISMEIDSHLFEAPAEIVCPITHQVFLDPVLTSAGHAYERKAIEQHMRINDTDPLSRQPLLNKSLTPVYILKSRALEYRESAARACLDKACTPGTQDAVLYLRRAVELASGASFKLHGLSSEAEAYIVSHPSNAYDRLALESFAQGLLSDGYRDKAAAVYYHLLSTDADLNHQAQLMRRCLACWGGDSMGAAAHARGGNGDAGVMEWDPHVIEKLVQLFNRNAVGLGGRGAAAAFGWLQVIDVAGLAGLGEEFTARLCEQLLFPPMPSAGSADPTISLPWDNEKQLLLKYVQTLSGGLQRRQHDVERRVKEIERRTGGGQGHKGGLNRIHGSSNSLGFSNRAGGSSEGRITRPRWLAHPAVLLAFGVVGVLGDGRHIVVKTINVLPLLALLPEGN